MEKTMTRDQVFNVVSGERDFQDKMVADPTRPDMIEDFHVGDGLSAIDYIRKDRFFHIKNRRR